jgi:hypothetical protein
MTTSSCALLRSLYSGCAIMAESWQNRLNSLPQQRKKVALLPRSYRAPTALRSLSHTLYREERSANAHPRPNPRGALQAAFLKRRRQAATPLHWQKAQRMILGVDDIVPEALHRSVGWDIRHHFMAEKLVDRFGLKLPRDRELIRQLAVVYVLEGRTKPPEVEAGQRAA